MMAGWRDALLPFSIGDGWMLAAEGGRVIFRWVVRVSCFIPAASLQLTHGAGNAAGMMY
jgi:hypothetical protein